MKVTLIADSCFLFEHDGIRILTDPWIGKTVAGGSWIQFPPPTISASEIGRLDYIFISHIHEDHCQLSTIKELDRNASIVLLDRHPNFVANFLNYHQLEFKSIITVKLREKYCIGSNFYLEPVEADPNHSLNNLIDSSLLLHYSDKTIYFGNDNPPYPGIDEYLCRYNFELAILPPVGGSGYPAFYSNLSKDEKLVASNTIISMYHAELADCLNRLRPKLFACAANGHVLSGKNAWMNQLMSWPSNANSPFLYLSKLDTKLYSKPMLINPGITINLDDYSGATLTEAITFYDNKSARDQFISEIASKEPYFYESFQLQPSVSFEKLLTLSYERLCKHLKANQINLPWSFNIAYPQDKVCSISLQPPYPISLDSVISNDNRLVISCDPRVLYFLLTGGFSWNIADATGFITYNRLPDQYIYDMYIALNHLRI